MKGIDNFINYLTEFPTSDSRSLNLYNGNYKEAEMRRENLRFYLYKMKELKPTRIFIGEAPGHNGCFITGVPFTDELTINTNSFFNGNIKTPIGHCLHKEKTASVIWECLSIIPQEDYPLMWNIYPFHPSFVDSCRLLPEERKNRTPSGQECNAGIQILERLLTLFDIKQFYAVGCISRDKLKSKYRDIQYLRHPSRGGANIFRKQFNDIYNDKR